MPRAAVATSFAGESTVKSTTDDQMKTISGHFFGESETESDNFTIHIIEKIREEYGMFVWPCAVVLAEYVWQQRDRFRGGVSVLEVLENIRSVCDLNKLDCQVAGIQWGVWDEYMFDFHPKIILGADVLYDSSAFDNLFSTVTFLLQNSPGSVFITTYHNRSGHHLIEFLMVKWGLKCIKLIDGFSFIPPDKASRLGGNIQLAEIALCHDEEI
ncbi:hypothetical protein Droror1_Dr00022048 [Drosera rotundifolia]